MKWIHTEAGKQWKREYNKKYMPEYCTGDYWKKKKAIYNQRYRGKKNAERKNISNTVNPA